MKPKKQKPIPLALVVKTVLALATRPEHRDTPLADLIQPAIEFIAATERVIASRA